MSLSNPTMRNSGLHPGLNIMPFFPSFHHKNRESYESDSLFISGATRNRTGDTRIFSPLLYQLSYGTSSVDCGCKGNAFVEISKAFGRKNAIVFATSMIFNTKDTKIILHPNNNITESLLPMQINRIGNRVFNSNHIKIKYFIYVCR